MAGTGDRHRSERVIGLAGTGMQRMIAAIHESKALAATRDALLPGLLSGELRVGEIEKVVGRVAQPSGLRSDVATIPS
jgi:hypothetical protein